MKVVKLFKPLFYPIIKKHNNISIVLSLKKNCGLHVPILFLLSVCNNKLNYVF